MAPSTPAPKEESEPPIISAPGTYELENISIGCKVYVRRPLPNGGEEERKAEVLSIRDPSKNRYLAHQIKTSNSEEKVEFYIHWTEFNKRLDEWVPSTRVVLTRELEWPKPKAPPQVAPTKKDVQQKDKRGNSLLKKATSTAALAAVAANPTAPSTPTPSTPTPRRFPSLQPSIAGSQTQDDDGDYSMEDADGEKDAEGEEDADGEADVTLDGLDPSNPTIQPTLSKEQEIEKLRHSGSMTQAASEIARVKNLNRLRMGKHEVEAWYFSPYPVEYAHLPLLYICEFCLMFFPSEFMFERHRTKCTLVHPPGNEIYRHEDISFFEIDGRKQMTWCRNLSLLSKCFLDHKTLYYDVQPFMYYCMVTRDQRGCHLIGYFSKEKESAEGYNVACILTLPQYQRHGYGKLLIEFSYALSKRESKIGSPEKPLSDLGLLGYRAYWAEAIIEVILNENLEETTFDEISARTSIKPEDILYTCMEYQLIKWKRNVPMICLTDAVKEQYAKAMMKRTRRIVPEKLKWKPPAFTRDQLRFGW
ncbi:histone acetyltransferase SAS3 [Ceratobasidium sp. AG-Ba]|nr:histone acetyltransferase SAS3 [Ceratobasidium sp. AG-Ba]